jgi:hypothetical protein
MLDYSRRARDAGPAPAKPVQEVSKARLSLRIPKPAARPGEPADFSKLRLSAAGTVRFTDAKSCLVDTLTGALTISAEHV